MLRMNPKYYEGFQITQVLFPKSSFHKVVVELIKTLIFKFVLGSNSCFQISLSETLQSCK